MRTEVEIRTALRLMAKHEDLKPTLADEGIMLPLNGMACDLLRWVVGEQSGFGDALAQVQAMWEAADRAGRN